MALPLPKNINDYQDRNLMTIEADDYLFILKEFHRLLRKTLHPSVYAVFCAIEDHAGPNEQDGIPAYTCFASHTTLAEEVNVKRLTVFRAVKTLEAAGLIQVEDREGETSFIHPIATPQQRAIYLLKHEKTPDTCIKKIQVIYPLFQNDTTTCIKKEQPPVSKTYTNVTTVKESQESNKTTDTNVSGEMLSPAANSQILNFPSLTDSPPDKASQPAPANGYEPDLGQIELAPKSSIPAQAQVRNQGAGDEKPAKPQPPAKEKEKEKEKKSKDPAFADDPRIAVWRKYALECHYKFWPNEQERNLIFSQIPNDELHIARWERLIQKWIDDEHGYKIFNIKGLVSVYMKGWRKSQNYQNQRGTYR